MTVKLAAISVLGHITRGTEDQKHVILIYKHANVLCR